jgi:AraC-like DNA-binding protein
MLLVRAPAPALRPFVETLWASDESGDDGAARCDRERVLPTGSMHLVFRLSDHPLRVYAGIGDREGSAIGLAIVGGARSGPYLRDVSQPVRSVGATFHPGAAGLLLGAPPGALAERHTPLDDLWGRCAGEARERLADAGPLACQLDAFESLLGARVPGAGRPHPAVVAALERLGAGEGVRAAVAASGYSHRRLIEIFRERVGLAPKLFARVLRFRKALARAAAPDAARWVDVAVAAGYSDQSHFQRDFREFSGVSPGLYRELAPRSAHHVPVPPRAGRGSIPSKTRDAPAARLGACPRGGGRR